jgi:hypothetical protein
MAKLTYDQISQLLKYDAHTGRLEWRERDVSLFLVADAQHRANVWNAQRAGKEALAHVTADGYKTGCIFNKHHKAHQVAWLLHHGEWPIGQIDHINGDRGDNRIDNIRVVSFTGNNRNRKIPRTNTSGAIGVYWRAARKKWCADVYVDGKRKRRLFPTFEAAVAGRKIAEQNLGYHPNHGRRE